MFQPDMWPFTPVCLSEIIAPDNLSVIVSGCCERLGRPLTILDCNSNAPVSCQRIESRNEKKRYEEFCRFLRSGGDVSGADEACKQEDLRQAAISLEEFAKTGNPFRVFACYMGLSDMTYVVCIRNRPVAVVFSGQFCPSDNVGHVEEIVHNLGRGAYSHIRLTDMARDRLLAQVRRLHPLPEDIQAGLEREAQHIQRFVEAEFEWRKRHWEQDFLDNLRRRLIEMEEIRDREDLQQKLGRLLDMIREFCRCSYLVFFGSTQERSTGLTPIAQVGLPPEIAAHLPHFNWKKAGLPLRYFEVWDIARRQPEAIKGLRGENAEYFVSGCVIPISLGDRHRGALVFGPFAERVNLQGEYRFLIDVADTVGLFALTGLEMLYLERERSRWESTAQLLTHQLRTGLTPVAAQIGRAKSLAKGGGLDTKRMCEFLTRAEDLALLLAQGASKTLKGHVLQVERDDLEFERYPLSVIVDNCAATFAKSVLDKGLELVVESSVDLLPEADVDVARLTIALANLIDNATKYSFSGSKIIIRSHIELAEGARPEMAVIEVDDIGLGIRNEDRERIFEQGTRGLTAAKLGHIPGSGLGLWEARAVVVAHGGEIHLRVTPTSIRRREGQADHVVFAIEIPLRQSGRPKGRKD